MALATLLVFQSAVFSVPDRTLDQWLDRTRRIESGGQRHAIGDGGRSRGPYQIQERAWRDFGGRRPWRVYAHDESEARRVARRYLKAAVSECARRGWRADFRHVRHLYQYGLYTTSTP